jgi:hypothetical protein
VEEGWCAVDISKALTVDVHRGPCGELLQRAWSALEPRTRSPVRQHSLSDSLHLAAGPTERLESRVIARWEDDGGYVPAEAGQAVRAEPTAVRTRVDAS